MKAIPSNPAVVWVMAVVLGVIVGAPGRALAQEEPPVLEGAVTINGGEATRGVRLAAIHDAEEVECGLATVGAGGSFAMPLSGSCPPGSEIRMVLAASEDRSEETYQVDGGRQEINVVFDISDFSLEGVLADAVAVGTVGVEVTSQAADGDPIEQLAEAVTGQAEPVVSKEDLGSVLMWLVWLLFPVLVAMVIARYFDSGRRVKLLAEMDKAKLDSLASLLEKNKDALGQKLFSRWIIEGLILSFVIIALVILGLGGTVTKEGVVSVLAAIVGYAAGRGTST